MILAEKGRIGLNTNPTAWMEGVLNAVPFRQATLNHEVAMKSRRIQLPHQDPADRFIVASAAVYDLILITSNRLLIDSTDGYAVFPI